MMSWQAIPQLQINLNACKRTTLPSNDQRREAHLVPPRPPSDFKEGLRSSRHRMEKPYGVSGV